MNIGAGIQPASLSPERLKSEVNTLADLAANHLVKSNPIASVVNVLGFETAHDGGGGKFYWDPDSEEDAFEGMVVEQIGGGTGRWKRIIEGQINALWFGLKADDNTIDAAIALGRAIEWVLYSTEHSTLYIPAGTYTIKSIIYPELLVGGVPTFYHITIRGTQEPYSTHGSKGSATVLDCPNELPFVFGLQGARSVNIYDISFNGYLPARPTEDDLINLTEDALYTQKRYAPLSAIAIDPFCNAVPSDGGYTGYESLYNTVLNSSKVKVENCFINGFPSAIVVSPNGITQQGDSIVFESIRIKDCINGIVTCQDQSRRIVANNLDMQRLKWCFVGDLYGDQRGIMPEISNLKIADHCAWIFRYAGASSYGHFNAVYAEGLYGLGFCESNFQPMSFVNCVFKFSPKTESKMNGFYNPQILKADYTSFIGCTLTIGGDTNVSQPLTMDVKQLYLFNNYLDSRILNIGKSIGVSRNTTFDFGNYVREAKVGTVNWGTDDYVEQDFQDITYNALDDTFSFDNGDNYTVGDVVVARHGYLPPPYSNTETTTPIGEVTAVAGTLVTFKSNVLPRENLNIRVLYKPTHAGVIRPVTKSVMLGSWNMISKDVQVISHFLTQKEVESVRNINVSIINDDKTTVYEFKQVAVIYFDNTSIYIERDVGGMFDNASFNQTGDFNRGYVTFEYVPEIVE